MNPAAPTLLFSCPNTPRTSAVIRVPSVLHEIAGNDRNCLEFFGFVLRSVATRPGNANGAKSLT